MRCYEDNIIPFKAMLGTYASPGEYRLPNNINVIPLRRKGLTGMRIIHGWKIIPDIQKDTREPLSEEEMRYWTDKLWLGSTGEKPIKK